MSIKSYLNKLIRLLNHKCPKCKNGRLVNDDIHNPDRFGIGLNIYTCDSCNEKHIAL